MSPFTTPEQLREYLKTQHLGDPKQTDAVRVLTDTVIALSDELARAQRDLEILRNQFLTMSTPTMTPPEPDMP